ncbi:MAG: hypothetical protein MK554_07000, partial [Planctomycetes bacterium]|nr:hypothetical protein [Planctomycetota bacterium]
MSFESRPFGVDASAPAIACENLPEIAGGRFSFEINLTDEGCATPESVQAFLRAGQDSWRADGLGRYPG